MIKCQFFKFSSSRKINSINTDGQLVVYDSAFNSDRRLARVLAHELAHEKYRLSSKQEKQDYSLKSGWKTAIGKDGIIYWESRSDESNVEVDSKISREEDFANNIEYFLFDPETLKRKTPQAYDWIKNKFGDKFKLKGTK